MCLCDSLPLQRLHVATYNFEHEGDLILSSILATMKYKIECLWTKTDRRVGFREKNCN